MTDIAAPRYNVPFTDPKTGIATREWYYWLLNPSVSNITVSQGISVPNGTITARQLVSVRPITVPSGGLGVSSGVSGAILGFTASTTISSSALLTQSALVLGGGAGATPSTPVGLGSATTLLHGDATGAPTWAQVNLANEIYNVLAVANGGTGSSSGVNLTTAVFGQLPIANGGTGASTAAQAGTNLGLLSMAYESSSAVAITGGTIDGTAIGATTPAALTATSLGNAGGRTDTSFSYQTPTTGFSITIGNGVYTLILDPAGALLTGTIVMPSAPGNGQLIRITSTQSISTLTVSPNAGQSIKNAPTAFTVSLTGDQGYEFIYRTANTTWYRLQ